MVGISIRSFPKKVILYCCIYNKITEAAKFSALTDEYLYKTGNMFFSLRLNGKERKGKELYLSV